MTSTQGKYRVAVLNSHPVQYFAPLYRRLAREPEIDLTVYYCDAGGSTEHFDSGFGRRVQWDIPLLDGYRHEFLANLRSQGLGGPLSLINPAIVRAILTQHYDALWLHGYSFATDWLALLSAIATRTPILYRSESSLRYDANTRRSRALLWIKSWVLRVLFRQVNGFLAIGTDNGNFYRHYGAPPERIFAVPYTVDNDFFRTQTELWRKQRNTLRAAIGIASEDVVFLFAAKMIAIKRPSELVQAFGRIARGRNAKLLLVGDGPELANVRELPTAQGIGGVVFAGFANQSELPKYYAISDVLVRPDGIYKGDWGLTVNEAMAAGLAVIATDQIGATTDLVKSGVNGRVVRFGSLDDLAAAMESLASDRAAVRRMGEASREMIKRWSYEECVKGVLSALHSIDETKGSENAECRSDRLRGVGN
jgi:glycosyltransferase involved in cell wall biosynthesis